MPVKVLFPPTPRFDQSLLAWLSRASDEIRNAFGRTIGGEWRTGVYTAAFVAVNVIHVNVPFNHTFKTGSPLVLISPAMATIAGMPDLEHWVTKSDTTSFNLLVKNYQYAGGANLTGNYPIRWLALIP